MTDYHLRKRIDIFIESPLVRTITKRLDTLKVSGYSVMPMIEGRGLWETWTSQGQVSNTSNMVAIFCIVDPSQLDAVIDEILTILKDRIGFLTVADVYVIRSERFSS